LQAGDHGFCLRLDWRQALTKLDLANGIARPNCRMKNDVAGEAILSQIGESEDFALAEQRLRARSLTLKSLLVRSPRRHNVADR
jgi:hypothetical protein